MSVRGLALVPVLIFVVVLSLMALATAGHGRAVQRGMDRRQHDARVRAALEYGLAVVETSLRRRLVDAGPVGANEIFGKTADVAFEGSFPPADTPVRDGGASLRVTCVVERSREVVRVRTIAGGDPAAGESPSRPRPVLRSVIHLPESDEGELARVLHDHVGDADAGVIEQLAASLVGRVFEDEDELASAVTELLASAPLSHATRERVVRGLDPLPRLRRTNSHSSRTDGKDRGSFPCPGAVISPRLSGRFVLIASCEDPTGKVVRARREVGLLERTRLALQDDWLRPGTRQSNGCDLRNVALGPELTSSGAWEMGVSVFHAAPLGVVPSSFEWRSSPPGALGIGPTGAVVAFREHHDGPLEIEPVDVSPAEVQAGSLPLVLRIPGIEVFVSISTDGALDLVSEAGREPLGHLPEFGGKAVLGAKHVGDDGREFHDLLVPTDSGFWSVPLRRTDPKRLDLGGHLILAPRTPRVTTRFRASLAGTLTASWNGEPFPPAGTVNETGSVLHGNDLSDLVVDGVYLSPLRGETLRYSTLESGVGVGGIPAESGSAGLLVKPQRSSAESSEPHRVRVVAKLTQLLRVTLDVGAAWVAVNHPQSPSVGDIVSIVREGPPERTAVATSLLERDVAERAWVHRRNVDVFGSPWVIRVWIGSPPVELPPWTVPPTLGGAVISSEARVEDVGPGGEWQRLELGWTRFGEASITRGTNTGAHSDSVESALTDGAFHVEDEDWIFEVGGELGDKAFRGTVRELLLDDRGNLGRRQGGPAEDDSIFHAVSAEDSPHVRWVIPRSFEPGDALRSVQALGDFPEGTGLRWLVEERGADGSTFTEHHGRRAVGFGNDRTRAADVSISLWLLPDSGRRRTPLVEAVVAEWVPATPSRIANVAPES